MREYFPERCHGYEGYENNMNNMNMANSMNMQGSMHNIQDSMSGFSGFREMEPMEKFMEQVKRCGSCTHDCYRGMVNFQVSRSLGNNKIYRCKYYINQCNKFENSFNICFISSVLMY